MKYFIPQLRMQSLALTKSVFSKTLLITLLLSLFACNLSKRIEQDKKGEQEKENIEEMFKQEFERTKIPGTNIVPTERLLLAKKRQQEIFANPVANLAPTPTGTLAAVPGISWNERGPNNVGGRVRAVLIDKNDATNKTVWVGGVGGSIWKTSDITAATPVWINAGDFFGNITVCAIAQDPSNPQNMYFGTGEAFNNIDAQKGLGIWKSTDGGITWNQMANTSSFNYVSDLVFDKNGKLYAAVRSATSNATGVMRYDGSSWTQVLSSTTSPVASNSNQCIGLIVSPSGDLYASFNSGNGRIYLSKNNATSPATGDNSTWLDITPNATGLVNGTANGLWQRIKLAPAPSDNNIIYGVFQGTSSNDITSVQQYNQSTNAWTVRTVPKIIDQNSNPANYPVYTRSQAWYDLSLAVDPNNSAKLVTGGVDDCTSLDNGQTWTQTTVWTVGSNEAAAGYSTLQNIHADHHNFVFLPGSSSTAILATDGGVYYTTNFNTINFSASPKVFPTYVAKNSGLNITQYYACDIIPTANTNYFLGGAQDNGSHKFTHTGINTVTYASGGDGGFCHISPINTQNQITAYTNNNYYISTDGGNSFPLAVVSTSGSGSFINPTDYDGNNLYGGGNGGSYFLWTNPQGNTASSSLVSVTAFSGGTVTHVAISKNTANTVYFGLNNGSVVKVPNANTASTGTVIATPRSGASVSCIAVDPTDATDNRMLVTYSNYSSSKIYLITNAQSTPTVRDITGNLPDMPVRWAIFDPRGTNMVMIATELGVWSCNDISATTPDWTTTNTGLANTRIDMLKYRSSDRTVLAASHGRGMFTTTIPSNTNPEINFALSANSYTEATANTTNTCVNYTDYNVNMYINAAPSGTATVTLNKVAGGTAVEGVDYDYTTNGVFGSGASKTITFLGGATDSKTFTVRIYDDAIVNGNRNFTLNFTTTGGNATVGTTTPTEAFTIVDNDVAIYPGSGTASSPNTVQIGATANTSLSSPLTTSLNTLTQTTYLASELTAAGLKAGSNINGLSLNVSSKNTTSAFGGFNIGLFQTTNAPTSSSGLQAGPFTTCYSGNFTSALGSNNFTFSSPFVWDGTSNIVVQFCFATTPSGSSDAVSAVSNALGSGIFTTILYTPTASCTLPTGGYGYSASAARPVINLKYFNPGTSVESTLNQSQTENINTNSSTYNFYSKATGNLISGLGSSNQNLGCVTAKISQAGNGFSAFNGGTISNKIWQIAPATANSTAGYTVTLYMTNAELNGVDPTNYKIYKTNVSNFSGASLSQIVTAPTTVVKNVNWTSFTASFTGFSWFAVGSGIVPLPIELISFTANAKSGYNLVQWQTANEIKFKGYELQSSIDGTNFNTIATINSKGNSINNYSYNDFSGYGLNQIYYRLKEIDIDGTTSYSQVITISNNKNMVTVYPNPVSNLLNVSLDAGTLNNAISIALIDVNGKTVLTQKVNLSGSNQQLNLSQLAPGKYFLKITCNNSIINKQIEIIR